MSDLGNVCVRERGPKRRLFRSIGTYSAEIRRPFKSESWMLSVKKFNQFVPLSQFFAAALSIPCDNRATSGLKQHSAP